MNTGKPDSGVAHRVLTTRNLFRYIMSFLPGLTFFDWYDGDLAMKRGYTDLIRNSKKLVYTEMAIIHGIISNRIDILKWLYQSGRINHIPISLSIIKELAVKNMFDAIVWLYRNKKMEHIRELTCDIVSAAIDNDNLDMIKWIYAHYKIDTPLNHYAAKKGNKAIFMWFATYHPEGFNKFAMDYAAENGHLDIVRWLHAHRREGCTPYAIEGAINNGHLDVVRWLHLNRPMQISSHVARSVAYKGDFEMVRWLIENRPEYNSPKDIHAILEMAQYSGNMEMIEWLYDRLYDRSVTRTSITCLSIVCAASAGHLDLVQFLFKKGHIYKVEEAVKEAINRGRFDVADWLLANLTPEQYHDNE
jgi:Ankyrin repeats (3 copies)